MPEMQQTDATPASLFLETTVQAARTLGSRREREEYGRAHTGCALLSSTYVLGEFKKTFLRDAVRFHQLLLDSETAAEALHRLDRTFSNRIHRRSVQIFAFLAKDDEMDRGTLLDRIGNLIEWQLESRFRHRLSAELLDSTRCARGGGQAVRTEAGYTLEDASCTKREPPACAIAEFLGANREFLVQIAEWLAGDASDNDMKRLVEACTHVLEGGNIHGRPCEALADAIIALEYPADAALETTNRKHFEPLCGALGKALAVWEWKWPPPPGAGPVVSP